MELHDIIVESSRYSLDTNENSKEDDVPPIDLDMGSYVSLKSQSDISGDFHMLTSQVST
jgi:hypothetical protein